MKTSGGDEAAQRADAVAIASMKPFAVLDEASQHQHATSRGRRSVPANIEERGCAVRVSRCDRRRRRCASRQYSLPAAEFIGKQLKGGKAEYADESMQDQPRKFGVLYPSNFDVDYFKAQLEKKGVTIASEGTYRAGRKRQPAGERPEIDAQLPR